MPTSPLDVQQADEAKKILLLIFFQINLHALRLPMKPPLPTVLSVLKKAH